MQKLGWGKKEGKKIHGTLIDGNLEPSVRSRPFALKGGGRINMQARDRGPGNEGKRCSDNKERHEKANGRTGVRKSKATNADGKRANEPRAKVR